MIHRHLLLLLAICVNAAYADVRTIVQTEGLNLKPIGPVPTLLYECKGCENIHAKLSAKANDLGFEVAPAKDGEVPHIKLGGVFKTTINGEIKTFTVDQALAEPEIEPPTVKASPSKPTSVGAPSSIFNMDGGLAQQGARLTGSASGGMFLSMLFNGTLMFIEKASGKDQSKPHSALLVEARSLNQQKETMFNIVAETNEVIKPEDLIVAGYAKAIDMVYKGYEYSRQSKFDW